jgi:hypothetical protein
LNGWIGEVRAILICAQRTPRIAASKAASASAPRKLRTNQSGIFKESEVIAFFLDQSLFSHQPMRARKIFGCTCGLWQSDKCQKETLAQLFGKLLTSHIFSFSCPEFLTLWPDWTSPPGWFMVNLVEILMLKKNI